MTQATLPAAQPPETSVAVIGAARWALVAGHRDRLLGIARRRCSDPADAEDVVHEAMLQCASYAALDESRVAQLLTSMTMRKCVDAHRGRVRRAALAARASGDVVEPGPEDRACDRAEARWLAGHLATLPAQQQQVLLARADGASPADIATSLEMSYKAVESTLSRARRTLRAALASASCVGALLAAVGRKLRLGGAPAMTTAAVIIGAGVTLAPFARPWAPPARRIPEARSVHVRAVARPVAVTRPAGRGEGVVVTTASRRPPARATTSGARGAPVVGQEVAAGDTEGRLTIEEDNDDYTPAQRLQHCVEEGVLLSAEEIRCRYPDENR